MHVIPLKRPQFWFRSPLFEIELGEDAETNPFCYGRAFAYWLAASLLDEGIKVDDVFPEDWGWCVMVKRSPYLLWVGCGSVQDDAKQTVDGSLPTGEEVVWTCIVAAEVPFLKKLFRVPNTEAEVDELYLRIKRIVTAARGTTLVNEPK